jgi:hypothetical protein
MNQRFDLNGLQMASAIEPARLSPCGVDEHAAITLALRARDRNCAIALSGDHFTPIEDQLAQGMVERSEREIKLAIAGALTFFDLRDLIPYPWARAASRDCSARRDGRGPQ